MGDFVTSANAQYLDSIPAEDYARTDIDETFEKKVYFGNDYYINNSGAGINISTDNDDSIARFQNNELKMKRPIELYSQSDSNYSVNPAMKIRTSFVGQSPDGQKTEFRFRSTDGSSIVGMGNGVSIQHHSNSSVNVGIDIEDYVNNFRRQDPDTGNYYEIAPQPLSSNNSPTFGGLTVNGNTTLGSNNELFVDDTSGNVGIGTTGPGTLLDVSGSSGDLVRITDDDATTNTETNVTLDFYGNGNQIARVGPKTTNDSNTYLTSEIGGDIILETSGNVGIGTTSPERRLTLSGGSTGSSSLQIENVSTGGRQWLIGSSDDSEGVGGGLLRFYDDTANADRMVINSTGNVGIGTTSPSELLDVNGTAKVNSLQFSDADGDGYNWEIGETLGNGNLAFSWVNDDIFQFDEFSPQQGSLFIRADGTSNALPGANYGAIYGKNGEIWVVDDAGNTTQISSHDEYGNYTVYHHDGINSRDVEIHVEQMAEFIDTVFGTHFYQVDQERIEPAQANFIGRFIIYLIGWLRCFKQPTKA